MTDLIEQEGTPERAADRGREEDLGYVVSSKPSLGDPVVVAKLVQDFGALVVGFRGRFIKGEITGEQALQSIRAAAKAYGDIAMGRNADYLALPWHSPQRLGHRIKLVVTPEPEITDPGELLFTEVGSSIVALGDALEDGRISDADGQESMRIMLDDVVSLLMGWR